jgi:hypothetical protein
MDAIDLLRMTAERLDALAIPYGLVGSAASSIYGTSRSTLDLDFACNIPPESMRPLVAAFPAPDFFVEFEAVRQAVLHRSTFNVIHPAGGMKLDFMLVRNEPWHLGQLRRLRRIEHPSGFSLSVAAPEDVIVGKLWYHAEGGSDKHLRDIAGMLRVSGDDIDRADVEKWAVHFGYVETWHRILAAVDAG